MATEPSIAPPHGGTPRRRGMAVGQVAGGERRDDLGVGGDLGADAQPVGGLEIGEVVDVAVERGGDVGAVGAADLVGVEGVGVGAGDDADRRPAGVAPGRRPRHRARSSARRSSPSACDGGPDRPGVVAELTDLGRRLVDERQARRSAGPPPGRRTARRGGRPARRRGRARSRSRPWPRTSTCSPAESRPRTSSRSMRGQRLLDGQVPADRGRDRLRARPGRRPPGRCGADPVPTAQCTSLSVDDAGGQRLQLGTRGGADAVVELGARSPRRRRRRGPRGWSARRPGRAGGRGRSPPARPGAAGPPRASASTASSQAAHRRAGPLGDAVQRRLGRAQRGPQLLRARCRSAGHAPEDGDDPAHRQDLGAVEARRPATPERAAKSGSTDISAS